MKSTLLSLKTTPETWFRFRKEESLFNADGSIEQIFLKMLILEIKNINLLQKDTHRYMALTT